MKIKTSGWVLIMGLLIFLFVFGLWAIDIGLGSAIAEASMPDIKIDITNGIWLRTPMLQYHIGLWLSAVSMFSMFMVAVHHVVKE